MNIPIAFLQMNELMWIGIIILVLFGGSRIPALMRSLGRGAGEFQKGVEDGKKLLEQAKQEAMAEPTPKPEQQP
jgi:sec-independent protein translocase protein TatA